MIGIDLGDKRVGTAMYIEGVVVPKDIVPRVKVISYLKNILESHKIDTIVVGLPYDLYSKKTKQLEKTKKFIEKLKVIFPLKKIVGVDERYTTFEAENILDTMGEKDKEGKKDAIAASLILESYIRSEKL